MLEQDRFVDRLVTEVVAGVRWSKQISPEEVSFAGLWVYGRPGLGKGWKLKPWYSRTVLRAVCTWIVDQVTVKWGGVGI